MIRRPPRSTRTDTLLPCTTLFRSPRIAAASVRMSSIVTQSLPLPLVKRSRGGEHRCIVPGALGGAREVGKARLAAEIVAIGVDRRALEPGRETEPAHRLLTDHRGIEIGRAHV